MITEKILVLGCGDERITPSCRKANYTGVKPKEILLSEAKQLKSNYKFTAVEEMRDLEIFSKI